MRTRFATKTMLAGAALAAGLAAAPATADAQQRYNHYGYERYDDRYDRYDRRGYNRDYVDPRRLYRFNRELSQIRHDIRDLRYRGLIDRKEARKLRKKTDKIQRKIQRMSYNGVTRWEVREARQNVRGLRQQIRHEIRDGRHRWGRDARYDRRYRDWDDDDRWDD
ncbi:hypothetical protein [Sphingomicrobium clamense]|uniref:Uncharacterized protein n=1 Tax=Sphingomicrobium clamense TaxID=2851013 RepID=A0ABS6V5E7_9SPHN|nr:hypothetical protein [Sphingomicrobium sp. B8]MBW0144797.1 hypothetical protein [Sphingomicrobium sp. B8]